MNNEYLQQNESPAYWWYAYGPFPPGLGNMPHGGRVVAAYRELAGWDAARLGAELGVKERQVYNIEGSPSLPEPFARRELLVKVLNIPPALMGMIVLSHIPGQGLSLTSLGEMSALSPSA